MTLRRSLTFTTLAVLLFAALGTAVADDQGKSGDKRPELRVGKHLEAREDHGSGKLLLHNEHIAVWFHVGKNHAKPDLRVAINGSDGNKSGYRVQILRILEVPQNGSATHERLARMNLARSDDWNVQTQSTNNSITLTMVHAEAQGIVTLVWHIDTVNATVKFDTKIDNWRWQDPQNRLVLDMLVLGRNLRNESGAKVTVEGAGYVSWADSATVVDANGSREIPVVAVTKSLRESRDEGDDDRHESEQENESEHEAKERDEAKGGHVFLVFNGTGGYSSLTYDPTFGVASVSSNPVPTLGPVAIVAAIAAIALLAAPMRPRK